MPGVHATLSASKAKQWLACPPSARLNQRILDRFGEESSAYAAEGTKAHALAELKLRKYLKEINAFTYDAQVKALGDIDAEMDRATDYYIDIVIERHLTAVNKCPDAKLLIEQRLDFSPWVPEGFGTGDAVVVSDAFLEVIDLKYGKGVPVYAENNPQARLYGLGGINAFGLLYDFESVRNTIVQPRLDSVTEEILLRDELLAWGESIKPIAELAWAGKGEYVPDDPREGGGHCQFCAARGICAARFLKVMSVVQESGFASPDVLDNSTIAATLKVLPLLKDWVKDFEEYTFAQAMRGEHFEGFKLVQGKRPPRIFRNPDEAQLIMARAGYTEQDYLHEPKMRSVADLEKLMGKSKFNALLGEEVLQKDGALVLAPEDDRRTEYSLADADFSDLNE